MATDTQSMTILISQRGLSLVELMIALVLGLVLSTGVITVFISAKQDYQVQDAISQVQENGRFSLEFLARDIRMAGYSGCSNDMPTANSIENAPASVGGFEEGLTGFEGDTATLPSSRFPNALPNTDAIVLHLADLNSELVVSNHNPSSAKIDVTNQHSYKPGAIMMLVDSNCSNRGIFVLSSPTNNNDNASHMVHNKGKSFTYGSLSGVSNCTKALKGDFTCDDTSGASSTAYSNGSSVFSISSFGYYIRDPDQDASLESPTLYRVNFSSEFDTSASDVYQPLVEGISGLDILYGVRDTSSDTVEYKTATEVESADEWQSVVGVRLELEAESLTEVDGSPVRREYVRTVKMRNRG